MKRLEVSGAVRPLQSSLGVKRLTIGFNIVTLASSHSTLPDDHDHTETCWSYCNFNVNFNTP